MEEFGAERVGCESAAGHGITAAQSARRQRPPYDVAAGYMLRVDPEECDRDLFQQLAAEGRATGSGRRRRGSRHVAPGAVLWRGPPFADFRYEPFAQAEIARLEELRLACLEERIEADLELGRHAELVGELEALTREQPLRQRPRGQLMLALYRTGRHADALEVYRATRRHSSRNLASSRAASSASSTRRSCAKTPSSTCPSRSRRDREHAPRRRA